MTKTKAMPKQKLNREERRNKKDGIVEYLKSLLGFVQPQDKEKVLSIEVLEIEDPESQEGQQELERFKELIEILAKNDENCRVIF